jgi:hypothetical protein
MKKGMLTVYRVYFTSGATVDVVVKDEDTSKLTLAMKENITMSYSTGRFDWVIDFSGVVAVNKIKRVSDDYEM